MTSAPRAPVIFLVAGEKSGDELGWKLMRALRVASHGDITMRGVGGEGMEREGLISPANATGKREILVPGDSARD